MSACNVVPSQNVTAPVLNFPTTFQLERGKYVIRLARTNEEIDSALRLRFAVFNIELREGLARSFASGKDEDDFDVQSDHVILIDRSNKQTVGTCRLRTYDHFRSDIGFYSSVRFNLRTLPNKVLENSAEFGRACIAKPHRNRDTFKLLWQFLTRYSALNDRRYLFGCCSMNSQDPVAGGQLFEWLLQAGHVHQEFRVIPRPGSKCIFYRSTTPNTCRVLPSAFHTCLKLGAKICGMPAIDREFRTIDFFTMLELSENQYR